MPPRSRSILTPRQWVVLERVARGESNETIARALGLTPGTVKAYLAAIYQRLSAVGVKNTRAALIAWYAGEGQRRRQREEGS